MGPANAPRAPPPGRTLPWIAHRVLLWIGYRVHRNNETKLKHNCFDSGWKRIHYFLDYECALKMACIHDVILLMLMFQ